MISNRFLFFTALVFSLRMAGPAAAGSSRQAATVVPFHGVGGKIPVKLADALTLQVVEAVRKSGGFAEVAVGYLKGASDPRTELRAYRVRLGSRCWVAAEIAQAPTREMMGWMSPVGGCSTRETRAALDGLLPKLIRLLKGEKRVGPRVSVTMARSSCERLLPTSDLFTLSDLLAIRLSARVKVVHLRWLDAVPRPRRDRKKIIQVVKTEDLTEGERRRLDIRRHLPAAKSLGVATLIVPGCAPKGKACELFAELVSSEDGKTFATVRAEAFDAAEGIPAALDKLAERIEAVCLKP